MNAHKGYACPRPVYGGGFVSSDIGRLNENRSETPQTLTPLCAKPVVRPSPYLVCVASFDSLDTRADGEVEMEWEDYSRFLNAAGED